MPSVYIYFDGFGEFDEQLDAENQDSNQQTWFPVHLENGY